MAGSVSENPPRTEVLFTPDQFLIAAYQSAVERYSGEPDAQITAVVMGVQYDYWDSETPHPQGPSIGLPVDIKEAVVIEQGGYLRAFALSYRHRSRYDWHPERSFQFGIFEVGAKERDWSNPRELRLFFMNGMGVYHAGEVYYHQRLEKLYTDGWADDRYFGGKDFRSKSPADQLSQRGLEMVEEFVERTFKNSTVVEAKLKPVTTAASN